MMSAFVLVVAAMCLSAVLVICRLLSRSTDPTKELGRLHALKGTTRESIRRTAHSLGRLEHGLDDAPGINEMWWLWWNSRIFTRTADHCSVSALRGEDRKAFSILHGELQAKHQLLSQRLAILLVARLVTTSLGHYAVGVYESYSQEVLILDDMSDMVEADMIRTLEGHLR